jgi:hypothetical protein
MFKNNENNLGLIFDDQYYLKNLDDLLYFINIILSKYFKDIVSL